MRKSREIPFAKLPHYQTFILHFWQEQNNDEKNQTWRFAIEDPKRGNRYGFSTLDEIVTFLQKQLSEDSF